MTSGPAGSPAPALVAALLGFFVITLDAVAVNVALAAMGRDLGTGLAGLQWVVDGYTLMFAALLLSAGAFSDRIGARQAFGYGIAAFMGASLGCAIAPNLGTLVAARFVQGAAAALMMPSSMALVREAFPDAIRRGRALSAWAMGGALAASSGPLLGGLLTMASWRWIFVLNLPVGLASLALVSRVGRSSSRPAPIDWVGQTTAILAMGALTFATIETGAGGIGTSPVLLALAIFAAALAVFAASQRRGAHPVVPSAMFRNRNASLAMGVGFAFMFGYFGLPFVMSLYLQTQRGLSPLAAGIGFLPMMLTGLLLTPFSARLAEAFGARALVAAGFISMAVGLAALAAVSPATPVAAMSWMMTLVGLAGPLVAPPIATVLLASVPRALAGTASGVYNTSRQIGGTLAVAGFGALLNRAASFESGMRVSLLVAAFVALATAAASLRLQAPRPRNGAAAAQATGRPPGSA